VLTYNDPVLLAASVNNVTRTSPISGYPQSDSILMFIDSTDNSLVTPSRLLNAGSLGTNADMYITDASVESSYYLAGNFYDKIMIGTNIDWWNFDSDPPTNYYGFWTAPVSSTNWLLKGTVAFKCAYPPPNYAPEMTYLLTTITNGNDTAYGNWGGITLANNLWVYTGGGQRFPAYMSTANGYDNQYYTGGVYADFPWPTNGALHWLIISWDNTASVSNLVGAYPTYIMTMDTNQVNSYTFDDPTWPNSLIGPLNTSLPVKIGIPGRSASQKLIIWNRALTLAEREEILSH